MATTPAACQYGVVRTPTFAGFWIRQFTESQVNHAFVVLGEDGEGDWDILEMQTHGAKLAKLSKFAGYEVYYSRLSLLEEEKALAPAATAAILRGRNGKGTKYNFLDLVVIGLMQLGLRWKWLQDRAQRLDRMICSQMVDYWFHLITVTLFADHRPDGLVAPCHLLNLIAAGYDVDNNGEVKH